VTGQTENGARPAPAPSSSASPSYPGHRVGSALLSRRGCDRLIGRPERSRVGVHRRRPASGNEPEVGEARLARAATKSGDERLEIKQLLVAAGPTAVVHRGPHPRVRPTRRHPRRDERPAHQAHRHLRQAWSDHACRPAGTAPRRVRRDPPCADDQVMLIWVGMIKGKTETRDGRRTVA
jgi:hypothetical protein